MKGTVAVAVFFVVPIVSIVIMVAVLSIPKSGYDRASPWRSRPSKNRCWKPDHDDLFRSNGQAFPAGPRCPQGFGNGRPPLLVISFDGFHPDYLVTRSHVLKHMNAFAECGARAEFMRPVFPSRTFPNHYSIVTGLYPESSGIIDKEMFDPKLGEHFKFGSDYTPPLWYLGKPIWIPDPKNQLKATAALYWPGSDVSGKHGRPVYWKRYETKTPFKDRIRQALLWLSYPEPHRPGVITLYFNEPDRQARRLGPNHPGLDQTLKKIDDTIGYLMRMLKATNMEGCVNIVLLSDHGMADSDCNKRVVLEDFVLRTTGSPLHNVSFFHRDGGFGRIRLKNSSEKYARDLVDELSCKHPAIHVWHKNDLPKRYHFFKGPRVEDVFLEMAPGWNLVSKNEPCEFATHDHDPIWRSMNALFIAQGPSFKTGFVSDPFEVVELYNLFASLLGIDSPAPNNGTEGSLNSMLTPSSRNFMKTVGVQLNPGGLDGARGVGSSSKFGGEVGKNISGGKNQFYFFLEEIRLPGRVDCNCSSAIRGQTFQNSSTSPPQPARSSQAYTGLSTDDPANKDGIPTGFTSFHAPWGFPSLIGRILASSSSAPTNSNSSGSHMKNSSTSSGTMSKGRVGILNYPDHVTGYSLEAKAAFWISQTLTAATLINSDTADGSKNSGASSITQTSAAANRPGFSFNIQPTLVTAGRNTEGDGGLRQEQGQGHQQPKGMNCWSRDPRVDSRSQATCHVLRYGGDYVRSGVPFQDGVRWITDIIPQSQNLTRVLSVLKKYLEARAFNSSAGINVVMGPVYDYVTDGLLDDPGDLKRFWDVGRLSKDSPPIPSDVFVVVTECVPPAILMESSSPWPFSTRSTSHTATVTELHLCPYNFLRVSSFILPNKDGLPRACQSVEDYLMQFSARLADVELATGLEFLPNVTPETRIRLRTSLPRNWWQMKAPDGSPVRGS